MPTLPRLGTTLYSFTPEFHAYKYSFADLVRLVASAGIGPGLEIVGFQSIPGFPHVSTEFEKTFRALVDETGLEPSCLAINVDRAKRRDRFLTVDELVDFITLQIRAAQTLGFPVARVQNLATPDVMERLVPVAEDAGVRLGMELHSPSMVRSGWAADILELCERLQSDHLGFIPDFGASTRAIAGSLFDAYAGRVPEDIQELAREVYARGENADFLIAEMEQRGEPIESRLFVMGAGMFGHLPVDHWRDIAPWTVHIHGKFYDIDPDGVEPTIDYKQVLGIFVEAGYDGYISSEWEAWHWVADRDARTMIQKHHAMQTRFLGELAAGS